jgi:hypothetical protein
VSSAGSEQLSKASYRSSGGFSGAPVSCCCACSRCAETALAWLGLYVGKPAQWTQLNRPGGAASGLHGPVSDEGVVVADPQDPERLSRVADGEQAKLDTLIVVSNAEGVVHTARITELA